MSKKLRDIIPIEENKKLAAAVAGAVGGLAVAAGAYSHHQQHKYDDEIARWKAKPPPSYMKYHTDQIRDKFRDLDNGIATMRKKVKLKVGPGWKSGRMSKNVEIKQGVDVPKRKFGAGATGSW